VNKCSRYQIYAYYEQCAVEWDAGEVIGNDATGFIVDNSENNDNSSLIL